MKDPLESVRRLVDGFHRHVHVLKGPATLEATVRQEYIDPFWRALGWDVGNRAQRSYAEKDVVIEPSVETVEGGRMRNRRPDYLFRIDGFPRFVVEAKKPAVELKTDLDSIFQAKTYAWNAQIPFTILTDFEEFRLFDATLKPDHGDPDRGLVRDFDLRFERYPEIWQAIAETFSRNAVAGGSLERLLGQIKKVRAGRRLRTADRMLVDLRGSEPVDRAFLAFLEGYRGRFARDLYESNKATFPEADTKHGAAKLTEAVQRLLDRLVFTRVCEDRDIVPYGDLRGTLDHASKERLDLYRLLVGRFRERNLQFNGYLFREHFSDGLTVSGELLAEFIRDLYPPESPYRFDAIGDDILGIVYERFLGNVVSLERGQIVIEEKPEVRHAGGVYYTPRFVVDTIVRRVIGPKVQGLTPQEVMKVRICDPACGSGSFLVAAYQFLIDHCLRYIEAHAEAAKAPATKRARKKTKDIAFRNGEEWHLAPDFRAELLTSCIHGVDIDAQAVEVTMMSLYLKMLEDPLPPGWQRTWVEDRLLPPLETNVQCGNSLISPDDFDRWWDESHGGLFAGNEDTKFRINAFEWRSPTLGFGRLIGADGGFDCVIGNPPYIRVQELNEWAPEECEFYKWRFKSAAEGNFDIYIVFVERALSLLGRDGLLGFIMPHKFWQAHYGRTLRRLIASGKHLRSVVDFTHQQVFRGATTYTAMGLTLHRAEETQMSFTKDRWLEAQGRGFESIPDMFACDGCFDDLALKSFVSTHATEHVCSYCGREDSLQPIAAAMDDIMVEIMAGIRFEWGQPEEEGIAYESAEGGWQWALTDIQDIVWDSGISSREDLIQDVLDAIEEPYWVERDPYALPRDQALAYGWQEFAELVKHKTRYMFLRTLDPEGDLRGAGEIPPAEILDHIAEALQEILGGRLVRDLEAGTVLFRARRQPGGSLFDTVEDLGPPMEQQATASTRMGPAGIPVFYGALNSETAIAEKLERVPTEPVVMAVGRFRAERPLRILDLSFVLPIPSVFDRGARHLRPATKFLRSFVAELSQPVAGDGKEHIEYVPTQVAAEYFRQVFRCRDGRSLDGLLYRSAKNPPHAACVLFFGREGCAGRDEVVVKEPKRDVRLRYECASRHDVTVPPGPERGAGRRLRRRSKARRRTSSDLCPGASMQPAQLQDTLHARKCRGAPTQSHPHTGCAPPVLPSRFMQRARLAPQYHPS